MKGDPTIPEAMRSELCQRTLDAQAACLEAFDAIEAGDLVRSIMHIHSAIGSLTEANTALKPVAALALVRLENSLGIRFGDRR